MQSARNRAALRILLAGDDRMELRALRFLLGQCGHELLGAEGGAQAIERFEREHPDLVLLHVALPEAVAIVRAIKSRGADGFVPVLLLGGPSDREALRLGLQAGADDCLLQPWDRFHLEPRMELFRRMREHHASLRQQTVDIVSRHERLLEEHEIAERLFARVVRRSWLDAPNIRHLLLPMGTFSGDLVLVARRPSGGQQVLVADFAGHGLQAAIGAMPIADVFYAMTEKGFSIVDIVQEMNLRLRRTLSTGLFCSACVVDHDAASGLVRVWNGGLPEVLVLSRDGGEPKRLLSRHLPLGIVDGTRLGKEVDTLEVLPGDRVYVYTDGLLDARDPQGESFGEKRLEECFLQASSPESVFDDVRNRLAAFRGDARQDDDISLLEIVCNTRSPRRSDSAQPSRSLFRQPMAWKASLELDASTLRSVDPLPLLIQMLFEVQGLHEHREHLYAILSELYCNALDHGILRLDSAWKISPQGFADYYAAWQKRIAELVEGCIRIDLTHEPLETGGRLTIRVRDSGPGFDHEAWGASRSEAQCFGGRGIRLLESLCESLVYHGKGNEVEAVYVWR